MKNKQALPWLKPGDPFPQVSEAWGEESAAPGLLAVGGELSVPCLVDAYSRGIFPWFSEGQPILWWSTDPRMVLQVANFKLHRSFRKKLQQFIATPHCEIRVDSEFRQVIEACATTSRMGQSGTWILPEMVDTYAQLHQQGFAHSIETWIDGRMVGGLYCVAIGKAVFGESMFSHVPEASKIALAALVALCRHGGVGAIDCQQNTPHLASMGAAEMPRAAFLQHVESARSLSAIAWEFSPLYWSHVLPSPSSTL